ncbi:protein of unknown function [Ruminococcaceae bacterium BL-4]|nr:protein of unknown function [Ruminococcaceae bacterium BL-4]
MVICFTLHILHLFNDPFDTEDVTYWNDYKSLCFPKIRANTNYAVIISCIWFFFLLMY